MPVIGPKRFAAFPKTHARSEVQHLVDELYMKLLKENCKFLNVPFIKPYFLCLIIVAKTKITQEDNYKDGLKTNNINVSRNLHPIIDSEF